MSFLSHVKLVIRFWQFCYVVREEVQKDDVYDDAYDSGSENEWEGELTEGAEADHDDPDVADENQEYMEFLSQEVGVFNASDYPFWREC